MGTRRPRKTEGPHQHQHCRRKRPQGRHKTAHCKDCGKRASIRIHQQGPYICKPCRAATSSPTPQPPVKRPSQTLAIYIPPPKTPNPNLNPIPPRSRAIRAGYCITCGGTYVLLTLHNDITCSIACATARQAIKKREGADRRRAREHKAFVSNVNRRQVFEQDAYLCHICNTQTDPTQTVPHPKAPTIDHVVPLAKGGTHEPSNCRTACFHCNSLKGDRFTAPQQQQQVC